VAEPSWTGRARQAAWLARVDRNRRAVQSPRYRPPALGAESQNRLVDVRGWLERNYTMTTVVVLVLIGVVIGGKGLLTLLGATA